jgi:hypothetical protein
MPRMRARGPARSVSGAAVAGFEVEHIAPVAL